MIQKLYIPPKKPANNSKAVLVLTKYTSASAGTKSTGKHLGFSGLQESSTPDELNNMKYLGTYIKISVKDKIVHSIYKSYNKSHYNIIKIQFKFQAATFLVPQVFSLIFTGK